ncbi:MAG: hypothetical protein IKR80_01340 [Spirochaetales bacterium]|nr:hypothetical protein [Spirochaetales bacterium]
METELAFETTNSITADMELEAAIRRRGGETERGLAVRGSNMDSCDDAIKRWLGL